MSRSHLTLLQVTGILSSLVLYCLAESERCRFPSSWKGKWYQNGLGEIIIRNRVMTKKGHCHEHYEDYYLVKKRDEDCYQCLLVIERHENLMQYRESFCLPRDTLRNICGEIQVERPLYTLVRDPAIPTQCPFNDAYYFDYNDQASGFCNNELSYAKPCAGHAKYQMHFKHCKEWAMFANSDLSFECIATWKDGSDFLYGYFTGHEMTDKDERFRCFKYQIFGTDIYLAMSVDATCQGLRNPRDGPVTMKFVKDIYGWPPATCKYPHWLSGVTWRDIEGKHTVNFTQDTHVMSDFSRRRMSAEPEIESEHRCVAQLGNEFSEEGATVTVSSFTTINCMSKYQCLRFTKNKSGKLEVYKGAMTDYDSRDECLKDEHYGAPEIWLQEDAPPVDCPMQGSYLTENSEGCHQRISIGCQNSTLLTFSSTCENSHAFSLQCLLTWQDMGRTYLLAREPGVDSRLVNCFSFKARHNNVHFTTDRKCGGGASGLLDKSVKYEHLGRESCEDAATNPVLPVRPLAPGEPHPFVPDPTTTAPTPRSPEYLEGDGTDDDDYYDFTYGEVNPGVDNDPNDPEVTRFPLPSNPQPAGGSQRREDGVAGEGTGRDWREPDEDSLSLAADIASRIEKNKKYHHYDSGANHDNTHSNNDPGPYPVYKPVDNGAAHPDTPDGPQSSSAGASGGLVCVQCANRDMLKTWLLCTWLVCSAVLLAR